MSGFVREVDLHGLTVDEARIRLESAVRNAGSGVYTIIAVHGYRGGTAIRDMIYWKFRSNPDVLRVEPGQQPGETRIVLKEL